MKVTLACAVALAAALAWLAEPLAAPSSAASVQAPAARGQSAAALPATRISVPGRGGDRVYQGVGAILGGGGNARYLMDYPPRQRTQILDYLFKPGYGAALQILKLEIGGDANSSDGSEASTEHSRGNVNCKAGYELSIAQRALALNPRLKIYGLQWTAPGWVKTHSGTRFTARDIRYLMGWLGCASRRGVKVSYLGGWNESDTGVHHRWFAELRHALNTHGFRRVQIVASDSSGNHAGWHYVGDRSVAILGAHDVCGVPTGIAGPATTCSSPWSRGHHPRQPMWASELGGMDAGAQTGCRVPCAPAFDRAVVRGYVDARLTGFLEWPVLDAMPPGLPYENRGLVTADQPWSGSYRVNAMTWAIAQLTQFAFPPAPSGKTRWRYVNSGQRIAARHRADGSYVSLVRSTRHTTGHHKRGAPPAGSRPGARSSRPPRRPRPSGPASTSPGRSPGPPRGARAGPATVSGSADSSARGSCASAASVPVAGGRFSLTRSGPAGSTR